MITLRKKHQSKLVDHVFNHLASRLASRDLPLGAHLNSKSIAEELSVSRSTIRKVLPRLVAAGWVRVDETGRPIVCGHPNGRVHPPQESFEWANRAERTYQQLFEKLLAGEYRPGESINAHLLTKELDASPATVRQAMDWLCHKGLLVRLPRRGWQVGHLTQADLDDAFNIRMLIEPRAVERAVSNLTADALDELEAECERMTGADSIPEYERRISDYRFHRTLLDGSQSQIFVEALDRVLHKVMLASCLAAPGYRLSRTAFDEHRSIIRAIRNGDQEEATAEMASHLRRARKRVLAGTVVEMVH